MTEPVSVTADEINSWADDFKGPVALCFKQNSCLSKASAA